MGAASIGAASICGASIGAAAVARLEGAVLVLLFGVARMRNKNAVLAVRVEAKSFLGISWQLCKRLKLAAGRCRQWWLVAKAALIQTALGEHTWWGALGRDQGSLRRPMPAPRLS